MQAHALHFDSVTRLRNPYTAQLPPLSNTKEVTLINLRESVFNIAVYQCTKVHVERCIVQNFKGLQFNAGIKELVFVDNRVGFEHGARTSTYMSRVEDLFRLIPDDN